MENLTTTTLLLRENFQIAAEFILEEIDIKKEFISFLQQSPGDQNIRTIQFEIRQLFILQAKFDRYTRISENIIVKSEFEHLGVFLIQPEHIEHPNNTTVADFTLIKNIFNYCSRHNSTHCECNVLCYR